MTVEKQPEQLKSNYWYKDNDCDSYIQAAIVEELDGLAPDKTYLLNKTFQENGKDWHVLITPSVNGQTNVPSHTLQVDYFLDATKHPDKNSGVDVFNEIQGILKRGEEQHFKILFPCNLGLYPADHQSVGGSHWVLGEIQITKKVNEDYTVQVFEHDPFGDGKMSSDNFNKICTAVQKRLKELPLAGCNINLEDVPSPYNKKRQTGGTECGVIVCDDLVKRATGKTLDMDNPHPAGAPELRKKQVNTIKKLQDKKDVKKPSKIIASDKSSSKLTGKNPRWEKFSDDIKIKEIVKKVFESDTETVKIEKRGKATIICENNQDEIRFEKTSKSYELATKSQDEKTLTLMVEKTEALLKELKLKLIIEIEAPDEKTKNLLMKLCKAKGLQVKEPTQQQQPEKETQDTSRVEKSLTK